MKNILEFLERDAREYGSKTVFSDLENSITYEELLLSSKRIGTAVSIVGARNKPIAVYMEKGIPLLSSMFGAVYSGNFYVVIDSEMPTDRINKIFKTLCPAAVITDKAHIEKARDLRFTGAILAYEDIVKSGIDEPLLSSIRKNQIDTDPLYALYTSGSTGMPKGAVVSHKSVIAYTKWFGEAFNITPSTVFGNQTPFYFSMSVSDVYSTIVNGASLVIIPKIYFSFPIKLIEFMNERQINTIYWVPSAIAIVSNYKLFKFAKPLYLKKVLFAGEVMATKQLNYWINNLDPDILYANLYGPTETTDICTYYTVDRKFNDDEPLPIGKHCDNCDVLIINDDGEEAGTNEEGELYVRGSFLASGYYNNPEKTREAFVQNPLNRVYPETVYKTGDLVRVNERGEIMYVTRKDYQIKHMGYRIELGEIETAASSMEKMQETVCIYDSVNDKIVLFYCAKKTGEVEIFSYLKTKLPDYLIPNKFIKMKSLPKNQNGKVDRLKLKESYENGTTA